MWPPSSRNAAWSLSDGYCICMNGKINLIFHREECAVVCVWRDWFFSRDGDKDSGISVPFSNIVSQHLLFYWSTWVPPLWDPYRKRKSFTYVSVYLPINCLPTGAGIYVVSSEPVLQDGLQHCCRFEGKTRKICSLPVWSVSGAQQGYKYKYFMLFYSKRKEPLWKDLEIDCFWCGAEGKTIF